MAFTKWQTVHFSEELAWWRRGIRVFQWPYLKLPEVPQINWMLPSAQLTLDLQTLSSALTQPMDFCLNIKKSQSPMACPFYFEALRIRSLDDTEHGTMRMPAPVSARCQYCMFMAKHLRQHAVVNPMIVEKWVMILNDWTHQSKSCRSDSQSWASMRKISTSKIAICHCSLLC